MDEIEDSERHRKLLLKALNKTRNLDRLQDLGPAFEVAGLSESDGMAAAEHLQSAGMLEWKSWQPPGMVRLLHPGRVATEKILKEENQAARLAFMRRAHELVEGSTTESFEWESVGSDIGLDRDAALKVVLYLVEKGLIKNESLVSYHLTQPGVDEVERAIERPDKPTEHLPAIQTVIVGNVTGFQQQHSSPGASQHQHIEILNADEIQLAETFVQEYRQQLATSSPNEEALAQVNEHLANIEEELESEQPDRGVIERAMQTLKHHPVGERRCSAPGRRSHRRGTRGNQRHGRERPSVEEFEVGRFRSLDLRAGRGEGAVESRVKCSIRDSDGRLWNRRRLGRCHPPTDSILASAGSRPARTSWGTPPRSLRTSGISSSVVALALSPWVQRIAEEAGRIGRTGDSGWHQESAKASPLPA